MKTNRRKIRIIWWMVITVISFLMGIFFAANNIPHSSRVTVFYTYIGLVMLSWLIINQLWYKNFMKTVDSYMPILRHQHNPDLYIAKNIELLNGKNSHQIKAVLNINICAGYCDKGDYKTARQYLYRINPDKIHYILKSIYYINLAYTSFYLNDSDKALEIMDKHRKDIFKYEGIENLGGYICILKIFEFIAKNEKEDARMLLEYSKPKWEDYDIQKDFKHIDVLLSL